MFSNQVRSQVLLLEEFLIAEMAVEVVFAFVLHSVQPEGGGASAAPRALVASQWLFLLHLRRFGHVPASRVVYYADDFVLFGFVYRVYETFFQKSGEMSPISARSGLAIVWGNIRKSKLLWGSADLQWAEFASWTPR